MKKVFLFFSVLFITVAFMVGCGGGNKDTAKVAASSITDTEKAEKKEEISSTDDAEKEVKIYLVRHGKTWFNTTDQVQGFCDSPLTDVGIEQAMTVGKNMSEIAFVKAYASSLGRQKDTAKYILAENSNDVPDIVEVDGLKEWNYGSYEGQMNEAMWSPIFEQNGLEFDEEWSQYMELMKMLGDKGVADAIAANDPENMAETYQEIVTRAKAGMDQIIEETLAAGGGNVLAVSSGSQIPVILSIIAPEQYHGEGIGNCTVTIISYKDGAYTLETIGDESYLAE